MTDKPNGQRAEDDAPAPSLALHPSIASARAAIHLLTSPLPDSGRTLALLGILSGLYGAYRHKGEGVPEWLVELMEDAR